MRICNYIKSAFAAAAACLAAQPASADLVWTADKGWQVQGGVIANVLGEEKNVTNALQAMNEGKKAQEDGSNRLALSYYKTVITQYPDSIFAPEAYYQMSLVYTNRGQFMDAFESLEVAAAGCASGRYCAVATAPISKFEMRKVGFNFAGQTEFFADRWHGTPVMAFAGKKLIVSLATWHEPLRAVPDSIDEAKISRAVEAACELARKLRGMENPRIAVCGLNPHAGEDGILGFEEIEIINPALDKLREKYPNLSKALPPDTVFERVLKGEFDCAVSMYHDQGLAPLKALEFDNAVNVSMNLKYLRTSPDHGTGYSIAGKGIASSNSFAAAVELALKVCGM